MSSSETESIFKEFKKLGGTPLKNKKTIMSFLTNDDKKRTFLENVKVFNQKYPNLNYADLLPEEAEKDQYKLDAVIRFIQDPTNKKALNDLAKNEDPDQTKPLLAKFQPSKFEVYSDDQQLTEIIYTKKKSKMPMEEEEVAAAAVSTEGIKEVVSPPKMRGSSRAKELKEAEEKKQRQPRESVIDRVTKAEEIEREKMEREEKLSKTKVDSMGNTFESEDDPRVIEEVSKSMEEMIKKIEAENKQQQPPPATATPATMSPDERDEAIGLSSKSMEEMIKKMEEQMEAEADTQKKELLRQQIEKVKAEAEEKRKSDIATMTLGKESPTGKVEETEIKDIPQDVLAIPKERASTKGKSEEQLINDIEYFFKTYPDMLDKEKAQFNKIQRGKSPALRKKQLMELHRRIVGKIGKIEDDKENKRIGIILNADKYLDNKINAILLQKLTEGLTPASLVVDVSDKTKTDSSKRVGSYQITKGRSGLLNAQKAPIYRSIPSTNDSQTRKSKRPIELKTLPTQRWDEVNTAKKQVRLDPFINEDKRPNRFDIYL